MRCASSSSPTVLRQDSVGRPVPRAGRRVLGQWWHPLHYFPTFLSASYLDDARIEMKTAVSRILTRSSVITALEILDRRVEARRLLLDLPAALADQRLDGLLVVGRRRRAPSGGAGYRRPASFGRASAPSRDLVEGVLARSLASGSGVVPTADVLSRRIRNPTAGALHFDGTGSAPASFGGCRAPRRCRRSDHGHRSAHVTSQLASAPASAWARRSCSRTTTPRPASARAIAES